MITNQTPKQDRNSKHGYLTICSFNAVVVPTFKSMKTAIELSSLFPQSSIFYRLYMEAVSAWDLYRFSTSSSRSPCQLHVL